MSSRPAPASHDSHHFINQSGCLCYGALHNILHGASRPPQTFSSPAPETFGTVLKSASDYNIRAQKGAWHVFPLVKTGTNEVSAWFACHEDADPTVELRRILRVSGSPYEHDHGSSFNDQTTAAQGILVINRYDWGGYDDRCADQIPQTAQLHNDSVGLVDHAQAGEAVRTWQEQAPQARQTLPSGTWLYSAHGEYLFARFGFDEARVHALSFLCFTDQTVFTQTSFMNSSTPVRQHESRLDTFHRNLREGHNFEGIDIARRLADTLSRHVPSAEEQVGPYDPVSYPLSLAHVSHFIAEAGALPLASETTDLVVEMVNEMVLSFLERSVVPVASSSNLAEAAEALFPDNASATSLDNRLHSRLVSRDVLPDPQASDPIGKMTLFVSSRAGTSTESLSDYINGIYRCIAFMLTETCELASQRAVGNGHDQIVPIDFRMAVITDAELCEKFEHSRVLQRGSRAQR
ncbi:hypothetical protein CAC42_1955 [Sphaceloma murrayae]|uniref:Uncharacterized protein n=1 Tax=Sphaceloma murrayae TaxID=2082308 RepID=A0A2K1QMJ9_9PEZI|nr:hypothetical protein CAC42_1955 [Sphaceloma murrayae]